MRLRRIRLRVRGLMILVAVAAIGFATVARRQQAREQKIRRGQISVHRNHMQRHRGFVNHPEWFADREDLKRLFEKVVAWHEEQARLLEQGGPLEDPKRRFHDDPDETRVGVWQAFLENMNEGLKCIHENDYMNAKHLLETALDLANRIDVGDAQLRECRAALAVAIRGDQIDKPRQTGKETGKGSGANLYPLARPPIE